MTASLNEKLHRVEWGEYRLGGENGLFDVKTVKSYDEGKLELFLLKKENLIEFVGRTRTDNGIKGYVEKLDTKPNSKNVISVSQIGNIVAQLRKEEWYASQNMFILTQKLEYDTLVSLFSVSMINKSLAEVFSEGYSNYPTLTRLQDLIIKLPTKNGEVDFDFMENFISELEQAKIRQLDEYLQATELQDYTLTSEEESVLSDFESGKFVWKTYNLEELFGKSTRGKRLKSEDRIPGNLPFVTAGEADEGISAFIGNTVDIFSKNTTTIDMFGSAKYRNYNYGGDDHIAVVQTENLSKLASIFTTTAIHKISYAGQFSYSRNFYAKDADELNISLPTKNNNPDYEMMEIFISAIQKLVVRDMVQYVERKMEGVE